VIIRLNQSLSDDEEYVEASRVIDTVPLESKKPVLVASSSLQDNISQFLKEAKNQAERIALHSLLPNPQTSAPPNRDG
jgi:Tfp pilus assembly pilus retraction ATPase PilT